MTKIYVFLGGSTEVPLIHTSVALTEQGRWLAGAVSQRPELANERCRQMAIAKAKVMLSDPETVVVVTSLADPAVRSALALAFKRMP